MAVVFKGSINSNVGTSSSTTLVIAITGIAIDVGDLVVIRWASDNLSATTPTVTCADGSGVNVYTVLRQGAVNATAAAGVAGGIIVCKATQSRPAGNNLTLTFSGAVAHKAAYAEVFTGVEATTRVAAVGATGTVASASAGATAAGIVAGDLVLGHLANETRGTITGDSDTTNGSWSTQVLVKSATSGTDSGCASVAGQYKIATATGAQTYNVTAIAAEWVCQCVVLQASPEPSITQAAYRFYDQGTESGSTALQAQDTAHTGDLSVGDGLGHLRVRLQATTAVAIPSTDDFTLQYEKNLSGSWVNVGTGAIIGYNDASLTEGAVTTSRLTGGTGSFVAGKVSEDGVADDVGWTASNYTELLFSVQFVAAQLAHNDTVRFRVLRNGATTGMTYTVTPLVTLVNLSQTWVGSVAAIGVAGESGSFIGSEVPVQVWAGPALTDGYDETHTPFSTTSMVTGRGAGQSFVGNGQNLSQVGFWLYRSGTPPSTITAALFAHSGTFGTSSVPTGTALAVSTNSVAAASLGTGSGAWVDFDFDGTFTLVNGTSYVIAFLTDMANDASNYIAVPFDTTTPTHPGNRSVRSAALSWTGQVADDQLFRLFTIATAASVATIGVAGQSGALVQAPHIDFVAPTGAMTEEAFELNVIGFGFVDGDSIRVAGDLYTDDTQFVSDTELYGVITLPASLGNITSTIDVVGVNGTSNAVPFDISTVTPSGPTPVLSTTFTASNGTALTALSNEGSAGGAVFANQSHGPGATPPAMNIEIQGNKGMVVNHATSELDTPYLYVVNVPSATSTYYYNLQIATASAGGYISMTTRFGGDYIVFEWWVHDTFINISGTNSGVGNHGLTFANGDIVHCLCQSEGTAHRMFLWKGSTMPSTPTLTGTGGSASPAAAQIEFQMKRGGGGQGTFYMDDLNTFDEPDVTWPFGEGGPAAQTWTGSVAAIGVAGESGAFVGGATTWVGSVAAIGTAGTTGVFVAGATTWTGGSTALAGVAGTTGAFVAGAVTWTGGSTALVGAAGTTGAFIQGAVSHPISASGSGITSGSAVILLASGLSISASGTGATSGSVALIATLTASGAGTGTSAGSAALTAILVARGIGTAAQSTGSAAITRQMALTASGTGTSAGAVSFTPIAMSASGTGIFAGSVTSIWTLAVSGVGTGTTTGVAAISRGRPINASGTGTSSGSVAIAISSGPVDHSMAGHGLAQSGGSVALISTLTMRGVGTGTSTGIATLGRTMPTAAGGIGLSGGSVSISRTMPLAASGASQFAGSIALTSRMALSASGLRTFTGSADISVGGQVSMSASGISTFGGSASIFAVTPMVDVNLTVGALREVEQFTIGEMRGGETTVGGYGDSVEVDDFAVVLSVGPTRLDVVFTVGDFDNDVVISDLETTSPVTIGGFSTEALVGPLRED